MFIILLYILAVVLFISRRRPGAPRGPQASRHGSSRRAPSNDDNDQQYTAPARRDEIYLVSSNFGVFDGAGGCGGTSDW